MIKKIADGIWKINAGSNAYFLDLDEKTMIDTGMRANHADLELYLSKLIGLDRIERVIFTHLHYDHIGNFDMFSNARLFASERAIQSFADNPLGTVLNKDMAEKFRSAELLPVEDSEDLKIIETPGHTKGSICIWYEKERILFSGDTMLGKGMGRTDLPTSDAESMKNTVMRLLKLNHKILCPGHDY